MKPLPLRMQKQLRNRAMTDEPFILEQLSFLAAFVHQTKLPKHLTASTYFPERISYVQSQGLDQELVQGLTVAYFCVDSWLNNHEALFYKILNSVSNMIPEHSKVEAIERLRTMAISIMLNHNPNKNSSLYKYLSGSLWLKSRSMFADLKTKKELFIYSHDISDLEALSVGQSDEPQCVILSPRSFRLLRLLFVGTTFSAFSTVLSMAEVSEEALSSLVDFVS